MANADFSQKQNSTSGGFDAGSYREQKHIIFFIIKQLCKFFVKIYLQNDSTFMPNWKQKIFLSHFPCSAKLLSCIIITDIRSILYSKVSCSGGKNHE